MKKKRARVIALLVALASMPEFSPSHAEENPQVYFVEDIECRGNTRTSCDYIRRKLQLAVYSNVSGESVQSARLRLSALPIFESVRLYFEKGSSRGRMLLVVEVVEASPIATELTAETNYRSIELPKPFDQSDPEFWSHSLSGRIANQNLFGRQKIVDAGILVSRAQSDNGDFQHSVGRAYAARIGYIDPAFAGIDRLFLSAGFSYSYARSDTEWRSPAYEVDSEATTRGKIAGVTLGYKFWDYAYVSAGYSYQESKLEFSWRSSSPSFPPSIAGVNSSELDSWRLAVGWDAEDDAYFPTQGSRFSAAVTYTDDMESLAQPRWNVAYKQTWSNRGRSIWSVNVGGEPIAPGDRLRPLASTLVSGLGLTYARNISSSERVGGIARGRWYVQASTGPVQLQRDGKVGGHPTFATIRIGIRLDTKVLGVVDLYATGSQEWPRLAN